jgi:hypothetical protein
LCFLSWVYPFCPVFFYGLVEHKRAKNFLQNKFSTFQEHMEECVHISKLSNPSNNFQNIRIILNYLSKFKRI